MSTPQKILIEFFDLDYLDNIIAPICEKYDRIIYIRRNDPKQTLRRSRDAHSRFLSKRTNAVPEFMIVEPYDYQRMVKVLEEITDAENDFTFDITGGTNLFIAGAGDFIARHLYELDALARHYCGKYAVKVLISTVESLVSIVSRAEDMNIKLIDNVQAVSHQDFLKKLAALAPVKK